MEKVQVETVVSPRVAGVDRSGMNTETGEPTRTRTSSSDNSVHAGRTLAAARPLVAKIMPAVISEAKRPDDDLFIWIPFCELTSGTTIRHDDSSLKRTSPRR